MAAPDPPGTRYADGGGIFASELQSNRADKVIVHPKHYPEDIRNGYKVTLMFFPEHEEVTPSPQLADPKMSLHHEMVMYTRADCNKE
eukprot:evm.model.scf_304.7 EVM.evm.TU.scf_304.7   scf_304:38297-40704(-)